MNALEVCPVVVVRFGSLPREVFFPPPSFDGPTLPELVAQESACTGMGQEVCEQLELQIGRAGEERRGALIALRRDVHNRRWSRVARTLERRKDDAELAVDLERLLSLAAAVQQCEARFDARLVASLRSRVAALRLVFLTSSASKGLLLSSPQFEKRLTSGDGDRLTAAGLDQTACTLLKYIVRCGAKTSPFSFFGPVALGDLSSANAALALPASPRWRSFTRVNAARLVPWLAARRNGGAAPRRVVVNSSLTCTPQGCFWLVQRGAREIVRRLPAADDVVLKELARAVQEAGSRDLGDRFRTWPAAVQEQLVTSGLVFVGPAEQTPFPEQLRAYVERPANAEVRRRTGTYWEHLDRFCSGGGSERADALHELAAEFSSPAVPAFSGEAVSHATAGGERLVREDVVLDGVLPVPEHRIAPHLGELAAFQDTFEPICGLAAARRALGHLMLDWLGPDADVPVLLLMRRVYEVLRTSGPNGDTGVDLWQLLLKWQRSSRVADKGSTDPARHLADAIRRRGLGPSADPGTIDALSLLEVAAPLEPEFVRLSGAFLQEARGQGGYEWIVSRLGIGGGHAIRRWLDCEPEARERFHRWRKAQAAEPAIDAVVIDDVHFHGDHGPRTFDRRLEIPGILQVDDELQPLPLRACRVRRSAQGTPVLTFEGRRIFVHYDSMFDRRFRPMTTQLLTLFARPGSGFDLAAASDFLRSCARTDEAPAAPTEIRHDPRVALGSRLVLARARWRIGRKHLPAFTNHPAVSVVARTYARWARQLGLPSQCYFRIRPQPSAAKSARVEHKPMYVDWTDPLWILFFHKHAAQALESITLEEALPSPATNDDRPGRHVSEVIVHWRHRCVPRVLP